MGRGGRRPAAHARVSPELRRARASEALVRAAGATRRMRARSRTNAGWSAVARGAGRVGGRGGDRMRGGQGDQSRARHSARPVVP